MYHKTLLLFQVPISRDLRGWVLNTASQENHAWKLKFAEVTPYMRIIIVKDKTRLPYKTCIGTPFCHKPFFYKFCNYSIIQSQTHIDNLLTSTVKYVVFPKKLLTYNAWKILNNVRSNSNN